MITPVKGIVFNILQAVVEREHGENTWDDLLVAAGVAGAYTSLGNYEDAELMALVDAAAARLGQHPDDVVRWFGSQAIPHFATRYPQLFDPHASTRAFVLTLNAIIHPEVRKLYPGADVPEFGFDTTDPGVLVMDYRSPRRLCAFGEGLIHGAAAHYGESATIEQPECMKRGDARCVLRIAFTEAATA